MDNNERPGKAEKNNVIFSPKIDRAINFVLTIALYMAAIYFVGHLILWMVE